VARPNVPFCRPLHNGMRGDDVRSHKRALSRAMPDAYPPMAFTPLFGPRFETAVKHFQRDQLIQSTGRIGRETHEALERAHKHGSKTAWAFDAKAIGQATAFCHEFSKSPEERVREAIVDTGFYWYAHKGSIAYSQARPFQLENPPGVPSRIDCSGFATACWHAGGGPDPNGRGFDGLGYTGTLISRGMPVQHLGDLKPGDLIFYGSTTNSSPAFPYGSPTHVAMFVGTIQGVVSVLSMGSYPMRLLPYNYRTINHLRHYNVV
jgi:hypothetical protein